MGQPLAILTHSEARIAQRAVPGAGDSIAWRAAEEALAEGRPAFWSLVTYGQAPFVDAAVLANRGTLELACHHIMHRRGDPVMSVARFLDAMRPANEAGQRKLAAAYHTLSAPILADEEA